MFEECCSLSQVGATEDITNQLAPQAQISPRAFERCSALRQISFEKTEYDPANLTRCLPEGCFRAGIVLLDLPPDFTWIGPAACENCKRLQRVDLSRADPQKWLFSIPAAHNSFDSLEQGLLLPKCHASNEATSNEDTVLQCGGAPGA